MVFHDHVHPQLVGKFGEPPQAVGRELLLLVGGPLARGIDADRMAAEPLRRLDPGKVVFDRLCAALVVGIAEVAETVAHHEHVRHTLVGRPLGEFGDVVAVAGLVLEELIDVFHGLDSELAPGGFGEVEVVELAAEDRPVQRPLCE